MIRLIIGLVLSINSYAYDTVINTERSKYQTHYVNVMIDNKTVGMLFDTGSAYTVVSTSVARNLDLTPVKRITAIMADGRKTNTVVYNIPLIVISGCQVKDVSAVVLPGNINILGMSAITKISPISFNPNAETVSFQCGVSRVLVLRCRGCSKY